MKRHLLTVFMTFAAVVLGGITFVVALFHQFALVEVAASILTGLQVFFLSSAIGDLLEDKKEANLTRNAASLFPWSSWRRFTPSRSTATESSPVRQG